MKMEKELQHACHGVVVNDPALREFLSPDGAIQINFGFRHNLIGDGGFDSGRHRHS
jgi:hypothetical protein